MSSSKTWGDLKPALPRDLYRGLVLRYREDMEIDADDERAAPDTWDGAAADLLADWEPDPTATLEYLEGPMSDGDFPDWPEQDAPAWMPKDIQERFGTIVTLTLNGDYLEQAQAIVAALAVHGYRCTRDDDLVCRAKGLDG